MTFIGALGPEGSYSWQAARLYNPNPIIRLYSDIISLLAALEQEKVEFAVVPVYNTRIGPVKDYIGRMQRLKKGVWVDNVILPINLSLGSLNLDSTLNRLISKAMVFRQCEEYLASRFPLATLVAVSDLTSAIHDIKAADKNDCGIIDSEENLLIHGFVIRERELASHNKTRFAVLGLKPAPRTGYDATTIVTTPLKDRVGLLYDILGEFSGRGVNLLDMRSDTDVITQKLSFYIEAEGHISDENMREALSRIERHIIQEAGSVTILGSYPRIDMRAKLIRKVGFIGTGNMSTWFAGRLENEGYETIITGRKTSLAPQEMIKDVDVVIVCVPISATHETVVRYAPLLKKGQAFILLAGEAEDSLKAALTHIDEGVEVMLVHNLWGPQVATMKDKNAAVVRTERSGPLCSEFIGFLYKHGAIISEDSPVTHDLMMGITQKLPTEISVALAMTLAGNNISTPDLNRHTTLTSLYGTLAMARVHSQNSRTYAEIMASKGQGRRIVRDFLSSLTRVLDLADSGEIDKLCDLIESNRVFLGEEFLAAGMKHALMVDETLGKMGRI